MEFPNALRQQNPLITHKNQVNLTTLKRTLREHDPSLTGVWQMNRNTIKSHITDYEVFGNGDSHPHCFVLKSVLLHHNARRLKWRKRHEI